MAALFCLCSDVCGFEVYQEVTGKTFMPLRECLSETCITNQTPGRISLMVRRVLRSVAMLSV